MELYDEEFLAKEQILIRRIRRFGQDDFADALETAIKFGNMNKRKKYLKNKRTYEAFLRNCPWACFASEMGVLFRTSGAVVYGRLRQRIRIMHVFTYFLGYTRQAQGPHSSWTIWSKDNMHISKITGASKMKKKARTGMGSVLYSTKEEKRFFRIMMLYASVDHKPSWQSGAITNMLRGENPILIKEGRQYNLQNRFRSEYRPFSTWLSSEEGIEIYKDWLELYHYPAPR